MLNNQLVLHLSFNFREGDVRPYLPLSHDLTAHRLAALGDGSFLFTFSATLTPVAVTRRAACYYDVYAKLLRFEFIRNNNILLLILLQLYSVDRWLS